MTPDQLLEELVAAAALDEWDLVTTILSEQTNETLGALLLLALEAHTEAYLFHLEAEGLL